MSEKDLVHHYKVLKQFLDISDDSSVRGKSNSTRAARAREKLLKLSSAQFKELSTDVYDELKRRIDESRGEPDHLLPKSTFHPKRNQARQKLASLPQTRFKDLVSDISFEIERRELHIEQTPNQNRQSSNGTAHHSQQSSHSNNNNNNPSSNNHSNGFHTLQKKASTASTSNGSVHQTDRSTMSEKSHSRGLHDSLARHREDDEEEEYEDIEKSVLSHNDTSVNGTVPNGNSTNHSIGIQSKTVVPTKANLIWSSDEEEDEDDVEKGPKKERKNSSGLVDNTREINNNNHNNNISHTQEQPQHDHFQQKLEQMTAENNQLKNTIAELTSKLATVEGKHKDIDEKHRLLVSDYESLSGQNRSLSDELEVLSEEKKAWNAEKEKARSLEKEREKADNSSNYEEEIAKLKSANAALRLENQSLKSTVTKEAGTSPKKVNTGLANAINNREINGIGNSPKGTIASVAAASGSIAPSRNKEIDAFFDKLSALDSKPDSNSTANTTAALKAELTRWQKKFEDARSNTISKDMASKALSNDSLSSLVAPHGLISMKLVADLQSLIESFLLSLNSADVDSDTLFDKISKLSIIANEVASQGDNQQLNSNEFSVVLRESVSHALTSTRYFAIYPNIFPRVVVERAVGEIGFGLCDLVSSVKLREHSSESRAIEPTTPEVSRTVTKEFGARPLRMANKLREVQNSLGPNGSDTDSKASEDSKKEETEEILPSTQRRTRSFKSLIPNAVIATTTSKPTSARTSTASQDVSNRSLDRDGSTKSTGNEAKSTPTMGSPRGAHISELTSKFEQQRNGESSDSSPKNSPNRATPQKNILDKVKHFESPAEEPPKYKLGVKSRKFSFDSDTESPFRQTDKKELSGPFDSPVAEKPISTEKAVPLGSSTGSVRKGLFQTLRDRLVSDNDNKTTIQDDTNISEEGISENEKTEVGDRDSTSTAETTPSRELEDEDNLDSDVSPSKGDKAGFFQSFRNRLTSQGSTTETEGDIPSTASEETVQNVNAPPSPRSIHSSNKTVSEAHIPAADVTPKQAPVTKGVTYSDDVKNNSESDFSEEDSTRSEARQRQEYRKSMAAATFNVDLFNIEDPDNTLTQVLLYLEHQTVQVISTIQSLLSAIKKPNATRGDLREKSKAITIVISQMTEATNTSMNQTRNAQLKEHGSWVVKSLEDCHHRMSILCKPNAEKSDSQFADKNFKQRLAGISFDIAKCTKELVKTVEEASLKEDIANLENRLSQVEDLS
ncbi:uncharacterized protein RJT20DRAFT_155720 [Scheffersomyces xylosifermentans]|uniref:uncharacterized protein n=1 Tax=Scheffersomyces xylosifermentans TaxID=1304137 RepID=UPI00315C65E1